MAAGSIGMRATRGMFWITALIPPRSRRLCWTHTGLGPMRGERSNLPPPRERTITRPRKGSVSVRMENDLVNRLKVLAAIKGVGYQTLLRQFVADRVYEEEKREGILE